jgi:ATP-dependent helicase YprA (DUF1998 family)
MLDPLKTATSIREHYIRYLTTAFNLRDRGLLAELKRALVNEVQLTKGPYLEVAPPHLRGRSVLELITAGVVTPALSKLSSAFPLDRPLYSHQEEAILKAISHRRNLVIATGTGSGKTECFLFPILDGLLREYQAGTLAQPGVRALLLYPMNALANDQVKRLRRLLADCPEVTFGRYVGETPSDRRKAVDDFRKRYPREPLVPNELLSREEMQARPPHLLLTNFAMLEYLLLRPADSALFDGDTGQYWQYVVLDEAHVYDGAQGTEIAMLIRRVRDRVNRTTRGRLQCFATSATLGRGEADYPTIAEFASNLFDERCEWVPNRPERQDVIGSRRAPLALADTTFDVTPDIYGSLLAALEAGEPPDALAALAAKAGVDAPTSLGAASPEAYLYQLLRGDRALRRVWQSMQRGARSVATVARDVFPNLGGESSLVALVSLGAAARPTPTDAPLLPARYHFLVRSLEGAFLCLHPRHPAGNPRLRLARHQECPSCLPANRSAMFELGTCRKCGAEYLAGDLRADDRLALPTATGPVAHFLLGRTVAESEDDEDELAVAGADIQDAFHLCASCRALLGGPDPCPCGSDAAPIPVVRVKPAKGADIIRRCASCAGRTGGEIVTRLRTGVDAPVAVVATSLYQKVPPTEQAAAGLVGEGRKLLCFSDSRQDAAFFAPYLERTYQRAVHRSLILRALQQVGESPARVDDLVVPVVREAEERRVLDPDAGALTNRKAVRTWLMEEILSLDRRQSLEGTGLVDIRVAVPTGAVIPDGLLRLGLTPADVFSLVQILLDTIRLAGAVTFPADVDVRDDVFFPRNREIGCRGQGSEGPVLAWVPGAASNRRLDILTRVLRAKSSKADPRKVLLGIWDYLTNAGSVWSKVLSSSTRPGIGVLWRLSYDRLDLQQHGPTTEPLVCDTCRQVWWRSIAGVCNSYRCGGRLEAIGAGADLPGAHYRALYQELLPIGMVASEHTAQWTPAEASRIQDEFIRGAVNVLSCSTTFELGVDVGDIEAVLLHNVPPSPANYLQRAGRAGRRTAAAALAVTFAQRRNHDAFYYGEPERLIDGLIAPPRLYMANTSIVRRHMHSIAFAAFERQGVEHKSVESFFGGTGGQATPCASFVAWLKGQPVPLGEALRRVIPESVAAEVGLSDWSWVEALVTSPVEHPNWGWLDRARAEVEEDLRELDLAIAEAAGAQQFPKAGALQRQRQTLAARPLIGFLSSRNVIPKYGFPVDVVQLNLARTGDPDASRIELDRDLRIAITEFAPGSQLVAAKALWRPLGLSTRAARAWPELFWAVCPDCGAFRRSIGPLEPPCPVCASHQAATDRGQFVIPVFGFAGGRDEKGPGESRPPRNNYSELFFSEYQGATPDQPAAVPGLGAEKLQCRFSRQGRISVLNRGPRQAGFHICTSCGFAKPAGGRGTTAAQHSDPRYPGRNCRGALRWLQLGHEFLTDVVELRIHVPQFTRLRARSIMYALLAGVGALAIRTEEMDGTLFAYASGVPPALVLLDTVPGGAGHAQRVARDLRLVATEARRIVASCECGPDSSCYGCLRNYRNQPWHEEIRRDWALEVLGGLLAAPV